MPRYLLSLDQGTTSSRAIIFSEKGEILASGQQEFTQHFPQPGWVEHNPAEIWQTTLSSAQHAINQLDCDPTDISAIGITNQRETTLVWDRATGEPIYPAIVWQDRRTADQCQALKNDGLEEKVAAKTGLLLDPYFSASKIAWILDHVDGARERAEKGELAFGTVDTYLLWQLTGGESHATDATNASRTLIFDIHNQRWDDELLELFRVPKAILPEVKDSSADFGKTRQALFGAEITIGGIAGDQQAALIGQACFEPGMAKSTYGTGCFMVMNTGEQALQSTSRMLTTVGYRIDGKTTYALEGSIFMAGATIQWIRDGLQLIDNAKETQPLAEQTGYDNPVYMVPAFAGLGAPYWDPQAKGAIMGLTRDTGIKEIVTAGLQAVCYQTRDLLEAMAKDGVKPAELRVDGGMVVNSWLMQFLSDTLALNITRPQVTETTALGAAFLAGLQVGIFDSLEDVSTLWVHEKEFVQQLDDETRERLYRGWQEAINRVRTQQ
ncbi:MAG: glycerol kinase GlpK [Saccharospirillaceae bacterium]|nr:glycerol kinase [Thalassolituus sp. HI0120]MCH2041627.1 glycerol kinase GlpK [Saccharospirillaceae bacterium]